MVFQPHCCNVAFGKKSSGNHSSLGLQLALHFQGFIMMIEGSFRVKMWTLAPGVPEANGKISTSVTEPFSSLCAPSTQGQVYDPAVST